ncbi:hypothetical protein Hdeb2414_s0016g00492211 [Helianthus debilis subsp. tardiflorus]
MFYFYKNIYIKKNKIKSLREECRHQIEGVRKVKGGVDVARADWVCVRGVTPLLEECPSHPNYLLHLKHTILNVIPITPNIGFMSNICFHFPSQYSQYHLSIRFSISW